MMHFFRKHITFHDTLFLSLIMLCALISVILITFNTVDFHFTTLPLFADKIVYKNWLNSLPLFGFGLLFLFYGIYIRNESPRSSTFLWGLGAFFWTVFVNITICHGIQSTPFPPIDQTLAAIDKWFGIDTPALMSWTHHHQRIHDILNYAYNFLTFEIVFVPFLLALFNARKALWIFLIAELMTFIIGTLIYYFFPTMSPSGIFHSPYFSLLQYDTALRFFQVHHAIPLTTDDGGLIAFPSFHVVWAVLLTNTCRGKKIFFYPLLLINCLIIVSTVMLGWHYLIDVISGFLLAIGGIVFAEWFWKKGLE